MLKMNKKSFNRMSFSFFVNFSKTKPFLYTLVDVLFVIVSRKQNLRPEFDKMCVRKIIIEMKGILNKVDSNHNSVIDLCNA